MSKRIAITGDLSRVTKLGSPVGGLRPVAKRLCDRQATQPTLAHGSFSYLRPMFSSCAPMCRCRAISVHARYPPRM